MSLYTWGGYVPENRRVYRKSRKSWSALNDHWARWRKEHYTTSQVTCRHFTPNMHRMTWSKTADMRKARMMKERMTRVTCGSTQLPLTLLNWNNNRPQPFRCATQSTQESDYKKKNLRLKLILTTLLGNEICCCTIDHLSLLNTEQSEIPLTYKSRLQKADNLYPYGGGLK